MSAWWRGLGRGQRVVVAVLGAVVAVNVLLSGLGSILGPEPGGPASSSFSTGQDGLEGYADLLEREGHDVTRHRSELDHLPLTPEATVVVADPQQLTEAETSVLVEFVQGGGRLVLAGESSARLLAGLTGQPVGHRIGEAAEDGLISVWVPVPPTGAAVEIAGDRGGRWSDPGSLLPVAGVGGEPTLLMASVGEGTVVALADSDPLQNKNLAEADNAAFALALAGPERPVVFAESVHGYASTGLSAIPTHWKWAAAGLGIALLAGLWSAGTRFGPPEPGARALRPPRRDHVDAVAAALEATDRRAGTVPSDRPPRGTDQ